MSRLWSVARRAAALAAVPLIALAGSVVQAGTAAAGTTAAPAHIVTRGVAPTGHHAGHPGPHPLCVGCVEWPD